MTKVKFAGLAFLLAALYILTGRLGLLLAVPPGYATLIWPPSGIALGMMLVYGRPVWPGVLLGSLVVNCWINGAVDLHHIDSLKLAAAFLIATASTLQAVAGYTLLKHFMGLPLDLKRRWHVLKALLLAGPVSCLIAATLSNGALLALGIMEPENILRSILTWWSGDVLGVWVFVPLVLVAPGTSNNLRWQGKRLESLPLLAVIILLAPLAFTFYAWKVSAQNNYAQGRNEFQAIVEESNNALRYRLDSYNYALLGGIGFLQMNTDITEQNWRDYAETIGIRKNYPGINGIGFITALQPDEREPFVERMRREMPEFRIHPDSEDRPLYIIRNIEPREKNLQAFGLNIGFEDNRTAAAELARDTGKSAITKRIILVQDEEKTLGFLLLHPLYAYGQPTNTVDERRAALKGWVYAPFIAKNFLKNLTNDQGKFYNLRIYDGTTADEEHLIYNSNNNTQPYASHYSFTQPVTVMQQNWLIVWDSTPFFDQNNASDSPFFILMGGLVFTGLFGIFLLVVTVRRTETMIWMTEERRYLLPLGIFVAGAVLSYGVYNVLQERENAVILAATMDESQKIEQIIAVQSEEKLSAIRRMAQRWQSAKGTPYQQWMDDTSNYIGQIAGLRAMEWADSTYHIRWVNPQKGNEQAVGLDIMYDEQRRTALEGAAERNAVTVTPPLDLVQGYKAFIAYAPINYDNKFDGFIVGIFSIEEFLEQSLPGETAKNFAIYFEYGGEPFYSTTSSGHVLEPAWKVEKNITIHDRTWKLRVIPTAEFTHSKLSHVPQTIFIAGLLIAALASLTLRYVMIARVKSRHLTRMNRFNDAIMTSSEHMIIATNKNGKVLTFNKAAEKALGYTSDEIVGKETPALWHDPAEIVKRAAELSREIGEAVDPGFRVFVTLPERDKTESRAWTFIRKDGTRFPGALTVSVMHDHMGAINGYLGVIEDISERLAQEKALQASEETFRSAMKYATTGMALVSLDGKWLRVNTALCKIIGYSADELMKTDFQTITHPDDLDIDLENLRQLLRGEIKSYQLEKRYFHKDGHTIWALLSVSLALKPDGTPSHFVSQIQDITEQREVDRLKSEFISVVSHELRTPLTSIRGSLGLIAGTMASELPEKAMNLINIAYKNSDRLIMLINDILDIDKIAAGKMRFDLKPEKVIDLVTIGIESNKPYADKFKVALVSNDIPETLMINVDADRWQQIFTNLLSNAVKFSPENGVVRIDTRYSGGFIRISVTDRGPGIPEEFRARLFSKFSQADSTSTRSKGGTGLGLHISQELTRHMHGTIGFDTKIGKGTTFWFEFPAYVPAAGNGNASSTA